MIEDLPNLLIGFVVIACRISAAFIMMPAFSSQRFPVTIRVMVALAISMALTPYLRVYIGTIKADMPLPELLPIVFSELIVGGLIGFWGSLFLHAIRFAGTFIANSIGLAGIPGQPLEEQEPNGPIANIMALVTTALIFGTDLHLISVQALAQSYENFPLGMLPQSSWISGKSIDLFRDTFILALQVCSPFIVYSVIMNMAVGFTSRFTPNLQLYFATTGLTTIVGFLLLYIASPQSVSLVVSAYGDWLQSGFQ